MSTGPRNRRAAADLNGEPIRHSHATEYESADCDVCRPRPAEPTDLDAVRKLAEDLPLPPHHCAAGDCGPVDCRRCDVGDGEKHRGQMLAMADELEALRARWFGLRAHITRIADAGARNDERQKVFEELRDIIVRLEGAE